MWTTPWGLGWPKWMECPLATCAESVPPKDSDADNLNSVCAVAYGCNPGDLTWVSALFVARGARGRGLGRRLLQRVVVDANRNGQHPCLEVLPVHPAAVNLYLSTGWRTVHQLQPVWLTSEAGAQGPGVNVMVLLDHQG